MQFFLGKVASVLSNVQISKRRRSSRDTYPDVARLRGDRIVATATYGEKGYESNQIHLSRPLLDHFQYLFACYPDERSDCVKTRQEPFDKLRANGRVVDFWCPRSVRGELSRTMNQAFTQSGDSEGSSL